MRWTPGQRSDNLEDRRGTRMRAGVGIGLGGLLILGLLTVITGQNSCPGAGAGSGPEAECAPSSRPRRESG
jgi:hypothetical protein